MKLCYINGIPLPYVNKIALYHHINGIMLQYINRIQLQLWNSINITEFS